MASYPETTTISTKGQVILPKAIRERQKWVSGMKLIVEERPDGVLLRATPLFKPTRFEDVFGSLQYDEPAKTIEEMDAGVLEQATRDWKRSMGE